MTTEEKAEDLIKKFRQFSNKGKSDYMLPQAKEEIKNAKQCALICCDEILENNFWENPDSKMNYIKYWHDVKEEIQKL